MGPFSFVITEYITRKNYRCLLIMCSETPIILNERFNKDKKFCKSSKCLDKEAILRWSVGRGIFLEILVY